MMNLIFAVDAVFGTESQEVGGENIERQGRNQKKEEKEKTVMFH